jgi:hypothetical protein
MLLCVTSVCMWISIPLKENIQSGEILETHTRNRKHTPVDRLSGLYISAGMVSKISRKFVH